MNGIAGTLKLKKVPKTKFYSAMPLNFE